MDISPENRPLYSRAKDSTILDCMEAYASDKLENSKRACFRPGPRSHVIAYRNGSRPGP